MNSITKNKLKRLALAAVGLAFWVLVWQIAAVALNKPYLIPTVPKTLSALWEITVSGKLFKTVALTLLRVLLGLSLGVVSGILLAFLTHRIAFLSAIVSPIISIIKSTPVASFIVILWVLFDGSTLAVFVAFLMVMPIIWQNLTDGFSAIDKELSEVCDVFEFSYAKRLRLLILPTLADYFIPALITSVGLAWKSEIAAEIIAYTKNSIGAMINDAKYFLETPKVFALTMIVVIMSLSLESLTKYLMRRYKNEPHN